MRSELEGKKHVESYLHALTHELKSPLTAIEGAAELLDEDLEEEARRRFARNIRAESGRLKQVVERLLRLSALESRTGLEEIQPCDVSTLLGEVAAERSVRAQATGVTVQVETMGLKTEGPATVRLDTEIGGVSSGTFTNESLFLFCKDDGRGTLGSGVAGEGFAGVIKLYSAGKTGTSVA